MTFLFNIGKEYFKKEQSTANLVSKDLGLNKIIYHFWWGWIMEQKYILGWMFDYFWYHNIGLKDVLDYFSLWIAGIEGKLLKSPEQVRPSQVYPVRHVHTCDPMVLVQFKFTWQERFLAHSSMSEKLLAFNHNSWNMIHV